MGLDMLDMNLNNEQGVPIVVANTLSDSTDTIVGSMSRNYSPSARNSKAGLVISKIEDIIEKMLDCLISEEKEIFINLKANRGRRAKNSISFPTLHENNTGSITRIAFPGKTPQEAWKFTVLLRILELIHEALLTGSIITKRDIYYRSPELFQKQYVVDRYVDDLSYTFGVERSDLNVTAAAKGLLVGNLKITKLDGSILDCTNDKDGILVPNINDVASIDIGSTTWILVVEKEASFSTIAGSTYCSQSAFGKGILVTAKGYPDIQTRIFLRLLVTQNPDIPIYALVDYDPDGFAILSTYKYGSASLSHENDSLVVPSIKWMGVHSNDVKNEREAERHELLALTKRDRSKAKGLLEQNEVREVIDAEWKRELQVMMMLGIKAEIQVLGNATKLDQYLDGKLTDQYHDG